MESKGTVIDLQMEGQGRGKLMLIVDFEKKTVSILEILPHTGNPIIVVEVQDYTKVGR